MSYDRNIYYSPEAFGLTVVGELNDPNASYSFDDFVVWQHTDGRLFYASDSGCSCPSPFEEISGIEDLTELRTSSWNEFQEAVEEHCAQYDYVHDPTSPPIGGGWTSDEYDDYQGNKHVRYTRRKPDEGSFAADKTQLLAKVSELLNDRHWQEAITEPVLVPRPEKRETVTFYADEFDAWRDRLSYCIASHDHPLDPNEVQEES